MVDEKCQLLTKLIDAVNEISSISDYRCCVKKQFCNLAKRLKLLIPMFEEIKDSKEPLIDDTFKSLAVFADALESAKEFLRFGKAESKIYLVLEREREHIMKRFNDVTASLEQALDGIDYEKLDISYEVREQVELVLAQFRRAKARIDAPDVELHDDLLSLYTNNNESVVDPGILKKLAERLQLMGIDDLTQESLALHEMVTSTGGDPDESIEKMSMLLKKIKDFVQSEHPSLDPDVRERSNPSSYSGQATADGSKKTIVIPDDFRCPISLELMKDPVIVSIGQTYERSCIEKWLACEANGIEAPIRPSSSQPGKTPSACSPAERNKIESLLAKLTSCNPEDQHFATGEIRLLVKHNVDNRVAIDEAGAIPLLVSLLSTPDSRTQEHAVITLLNLSICEDNKGAIVSFGAVFGIVHVLKKGSMEARENAAATLFSLSVIDENKVTIGNSGAIQPLVTLLNGGTQRGKKDATTALFNLCIFQGNKGKAVRAGVVPILMRLLTEPGGGMVDEALVVLAILASHQEGKAAIASADALPALVEVIGNGSPRNKANVVVVLLHLCSGDHQNMATAQKLGVMEPLVEMAQSDTERGKRKALQLLV